MAIKAYKVDTDWYYLTGYYKSDLIYIDVIKNGRGKWIAHFARDKQRIILAGPCRTRMGVYEALEDKIIVHMDYLK